MRAELESHPLISFPPQTVLQLPKAPQIGRPGHTTTTTTASTMTVSDYKNASGDSDSEDWGQWSPESAKSTSTRRLSASHSDEMQTDESARGTKRKPDHTCTDRPVTGRFSSLKQ